MTAFLAGHAVPLAVRDREKDHRARRGRDRSSLAETKPIDKPQSSPASLPVCETTRRQCPGVIRAAALRHLHRKSSEEGLEQEFNSLQAQSEACEAYIRSQLSRGLGIGEDPLRRWRVSGGNMERPALQRLLADIRGGSIDIVVRLQGSTG